MRYVYYAREEHSNWLPSAKHSMNRTSYMCVCACMFEITIYFLKKVMNLKESREECMGGLRGRKEREKRDPITISKVKNPNRRT